MVSAEIRELARNIFKVDPNVIHLGLIDLEGHVLLDQSSSAPEPMEPDDDRIMFYYQVGLRRSRREHFNEVYGNTTYIHIQREKIQQLVLYLPMFTVYLSVEKDVNPDGIAKIAGKIRGIDETILDKAVKSLFYV